MDQGMKAFYIMMYDLNPDNCIAVPKELTAKNKIQSIELRIGNEFQAMLEFLKNSISAIPNVIDIFSTRKLAESTPFKQMYMELLVTYGVIKHQKNSIGTLEKVAVYNGFPDFIDSEEFAKDPQGIFSKGIDAALKKASFGPHPISQPTLYQQLHLSFTTEFLKQNPLYVTENGKRTEVSPLN